MRKIDKIIIHCSDTVEGVPYTIKDIRKWHLNRGFEDVGYHYVITLDGRVQRGRSLAKFGAHCKGENSHSIGICYIGGRTSSGEYKDTRTEQQKEALRKLIADIKQLYPEITCHGHNEFANKACPCFDVKKEF